LPARWNLRLAQRASPKKRCIPPERRRAAVLCAQAALYAAKTDKAALTRATKKADGILRELVALTLRSDLTRAQRTSLETCITVHMHQKEVGAAWTAPRG
jgi:hypothetical protein